MARDYYNLPKDAKFRDVILSIRADETIHRETNHFFTDSGTEEPIEVEKVYVIGRDSNNLEIAK